MEDGVRRESSGEEERVDVRIGVDVNWKQIFQKRVVSK